MTIEAFRKIREERGESAKYGNLCWYCKFNCSEEFAESRKLNCPIFMEQDKTVKRAYTYKAFKELQEAYNDSLIQAHGRLRRLTKGIDP